LYTNNSVSQSTFYFQDDRTANANPMITLIARTPVCIIQAAAMQSCFAVRGSFVRRLRS